MPKIKTLRAAAKRFKKTASGKFMRGHALHRHILTKKSPDKKRHLGASAVIEPCDAKKVARMLPYAK